MMYQLAMCHAAREFGLEVHQYPRGDEMAPAAERLGVTTDDIESFVNHAGRPPGAPWTQEHRRAFAAGIAALAVHSRAKARITTMR